MFKKTSRRFGIEQRKTNTFGWSKRHGGAGSVACTITVALLVIGLAFTVTAKPIRINSDTIGEPQVPNDDSDNLPLERPVKTQSEPNYTPGISSRLPV